MKIGITYLYTIYTYGYPPRLQDDFKAIAEIARMGFHYLEMEGLGGNHTEDVWSHRADLKKCLDDNGVRVHNFCAVDPFLVSMDDAQRHAAYERFHRTAELGAYFGTETLHLASYSPPVTYGGKAPYQLDEDYTFGDTFEVKIPDGFSWPRVWSVLVESCRHTADVAAQHGRTIIMEPRVGEIICTPDSLLRLIEHVDRPNFKANFDTGHFCAQRENVALALMKLEDKFANIHISDNDPRTTDHLPIGEGAIDWREFLRVLKGMNYTGYLGLDLGGRTSLVDDYAKSVHYLQNLGEELGISFEV